MLPAVDAGPASRLARWHVGSVTITAVLETTTAFSAAFLRALIPGATAPALATLPWLNPHWVDVQGDLRFVTQAFLIASQGRRIVVDTCLGNDKVRKNPACHRLATPFLADLARAGATPEAVDVVLCTHLHFDHVGWNTRWTGERWVPTFPRARYLIARTEWEHWRARPEHAWVFDDSLAPVAEAGLVTLVDSDHEVTDEVRLEPTPGHTPGHVAVRIRSRGEEALITGDLLHHPCQIAHPEWTGPADADPTQTRSTRHAVLDDAARRGVLVVGSHFAPPAAGHVVADAADARWRLVPASPEAQP